MKNILNQKYKGGFFLCFAANVTLNTCDASEMTPKNLSDPSVVVEPASNYPEGNPYYMGLRFFNFQGANVSLHDTSGFFDNVGMAQGGGQDRSYMDGYVFRDSSDNLGDTILPSRTHFFGFDSIDQYVADASGGSLQLHSLRRKENKAGRSFPKSVSSGVEWNLGRRMKSWNKWSFNLEGFVSFSRSRSSSGASAASFELLTDTYSTGFVDPTVLGVPYAGEYQPQWGGSPKIGDEPSRSLSVISGQVHGQSTLESNTIMIRVGPSLLYRPRSWIAMGIGAGLTLTTVKADLSYNESEQVQWKGQDYHRQLRGSLSKSSTLLGAYAGVQLDLRMSSHWSLNTELDAAHLGQMELENAQRHLEMNLGSILMTAIGLRYQF